ncbi:MAG: protease complex subunit PrcB family protein [Lachnospiraceae bacterium]|nr:protease complex subunit PrcB family protein [Lachnospiraceae bacterium]
MKKLVKPVMKGILMGVFVIFLFQIQGCKIKVVSKEEPRSEVRFSIISEECIPESLSNLINKKKEKIMKMTYVDEGKRFIVVGYGAQNSGGYSIYIKDLYKTENAIYVDTCLVGPEEKKIKEGVVSYPCIVLQISEMGLPVVFQ